MAQKSTIVSSGFIQLNMLPGAFETPLQFTDGISRNCLVIPLDGNDVVKKSVKNNVTKIIAGLNIFKNEVPDKFGQTHYFRFSLTKEADERLSRMENGEQAKKNLTMICGNAKPVQKKNTPAPAAAPVGPVYQQGYVAPQQNYPQAAPAAPTYPQGQNYPQQGQGYYPPGQQGVPAAPAAPAGAPGMARPAPGFGPDRPYNQYDDGDLPMGPGPRGING